MRRCLGQRNGGHQSSQRPNLQIRASSGYLIYAYDAENQLTTVQFGTYYKTDFVYDGRGRLRKRIEYTWNSQMSVWQTSSETRYVYDGMRVIQERNSSNTPQVAYTRGRDLSGSFEAAGGIGGLLSRSHAYQSGSGSFTNNNYYHADGGGNVTYMVDTNQANVATYRYDPYGNQISSSGSLASANLYRFSSKEIHVNSGLYYYGYRFYDPNLQRWLNRDPVEEVGFRVLQQQREQLRQAEVNLYAFVHNDPLQWVDPYGLITAKGYVGVVCFGLGGVVVLATPAKPAGVVLMVVGGGLIIWDVVESVKLIDKVKDWFQGGPNKDSDGDGMPDRLDPAPNDPNE